MLAVKIALPLLAAVAAANPLAKRQSSTTCGDNYYSSDDVSNSANAACNYLQDGQTVGSDSYPHQYKNYEGFSFPVSSPWYEFPLESGETYDGGSPGADRVIINGNCEYAGAITHTGASSENGFVGCSGTS